MIVKIVWKPRQLVSHNKQIGVVERVYDNVVYINIAGKHLEAPNIPNNSLRMLAVQDKDKILLKCEDGNMRSYTLKDILISRKKQVVTLVPEDTARRTRVYDIAMLLTQNFIFA